MFRLKPVYVFLLLAVFLTSCDNKASSTATPTVSVAAPDATESVTAAPDATESVTAAPDATESVTAAPDATESVTAAPDATESVTAAPDATESVTAAPDATESVTAAPDVTESITAAPDVTESVTAAPDATESVTAAPDVTEEVTLSPTVVTPVPIPTPPNPVGNCAISLNGQSFYISGGGGGLSSILQGTLAPWNDVKTLVDGYTSSITPKDNVAILVADDFRGTSPDEVLANKPDESLLAKPVTPTVNNISHGLLVFQHINTLLKKMGYTLVSTATIAIPDIANHVLMSDWEIASSHLYVVQVDSAEAPDGYGYNTNTIHQNVIKTINDLANNPSTSVARFVVNMSFSILPCKDVYDFEYRFVKQGRTFEDYKNEVEASPNVTDFGAWLNAESLKVAAPASIAEDNLYQYIDGNKDVIFVASAGNFGDITRTISDFRFYPGGWDGVINVSGFEGMTTPGTWWPFSNLGEVNLPAAWFEYDIVPGYYYAGTSFAAPIMSVIAALYASEPPVACPFATIPPDFAATPYPSPASIPDFGQLSGRPPC